MGYRLHYAEKYDVSYSGGYFNWCADVFAEMARAEEISYWSDAETYADATEYELDPEKLKEYIEKLKTLPPDEKNQYFEKRDDADSWSNKQVLDSLQEILDGYDKNNTFIRCSWF